MAPSFCCWPRWLFFSFCRKGLQATPYFLLIVECEFMSVGLVTACWTYHDYKLCIVYSVIVNGFVLMWFKIISFFSGERDTHVQAVYE